MRPGMEKAIAVFDIGKTNKKFLLFGLGYKLIAEEEIKFPEIEDDDGFPCDDIGKIETWMKNVLKKVLDEGKYELAGLNFATYGATIAFLNSEGKRCAPVYNYLKPMPALLKEKFNRRHNGNGDFFRKTASPDLGLLNSGMQAYYLKYAKPALFINVKTILHLPHYFAGLFNGRASAELTSIGCHTAMWDFDKSQYHQWLNDEGIILPAPEKNDTVIECEFAGHKINSGIGIHDSSASLVPYLKAGGKFVLISSGTWCINMNPFNQTPLTKEELEKDCLCYLSAEGKQVKSSRFFMGHYHDSFLAQLEEVFSAEKGAFKNVSPDIEKLHSWMNENTPPLFGAGTELPAMVSFSSFGEAYNRLMFDLTMMEIESLSLVIPPDDTTENIYISGGFAANPIFTRLIASRFSNKNVYISEVPNSTALGAAMALNLFDSDIDLGLKKIEPLF